MSKANSFHEDFNRSDAEPLGSNRSFGLLFAFVFALIAVWPLIWSQEVRWWSVVVAAAFLIAALLRSTVLQPLNRAWMAFGRLLHRMVTPLIMGLLFFAVVTPAAWLMRRFGAVPLRLAFEPAAWSYWIRRTPPGPEPDTMSRQF